MAGITRENVRYYADVEEDERARIKSEVREKFPQPDNENNAEKAVRYREAGLHLLFEHGVYSHTVRDIFKE